TATFPLKWSRERRRIEMISKAQGASKGLVQGFRSYYRRFGTPGLMAVFSLVLVIGTGAAYAGQKVAHSSKKPKAKAGPPGPQGPAGPAGSNGAPGAPGADGKSVLNGSGAPSNSLGNNGDFYLDTASANQNLYGPKAGGVWPGSPVALKGSNGTN